MQIERYKYMTMNRSTVMALLLALVSALTAFYSPMSVAEEKGWFGLGFSVESEGFSLNPTIQSVKIEKLAAPSPGSRAGLMVGDIVVSVQGIACAGAKADDLKAAMKKSVGETLRLKAKRGTAEPFEVSLVAIAKPPSS